MAITPTGGNAATATTAATTAAGALPVPRTAPLTR